ncbi:hypothetical protein [Chryseobacterium lactis]|uniref:hypothetical protein n=1 Tax=Chryseobacterium lactis TaxID=1241981 RepID=UPI001627FA88|nr:hypothetical protein [Chryseobacterium lactis]
MERDISIYMFDKEKAAVYLYKDLQRRIYHTSTFKNHIEGKEKQDLNGNISFDRILESVRNDINMMHPDDLYEIIHFFTSQIHSLFPDDSIEAREEYIATLYDYLGITRLCELNTTKAGKAYIYFYKTYIDYFPMDSIMGENFSINIRSEDFLRFNDFLILLTKKIIESKLYDDNDILTEEEEISIETIKTETQNNTLLSEAIEDEMRFLTKTFYPDEREDYIQAVYHSFTFLKQAITIRLKIDVQKNPRIIIVDIY